MSDTDVEVYYFSNGTEGRAWMANWCDRCTNDHEYAHVEPFYDGGNGGCEHIVAMLTRRADPMLVQVPGPRWEEWHCMDFRRCSCDRGPDDPPGEEPEPPVHPGQGELFDGGALMPGVPRGTVLDALVPSILDQIKAAEIVFGARLSSGEKDR